MRNRFFIEHQATGTAKGFETAREVALYLSGRNIEDFAIYRRLDFLPSDCRDLEALLTADADDQLLLSLQERVNRDEQYDRDDHVIDGHSIKWHALFILGNARAYLRASKIDETVYAVYMPIFTREGPSFWRGDFHTMRIDCVESGVIGTPEHSYTVRHIREWRMRAEPEKIVFEEVTKIEKKI